MHTCTPLYTGDALFTITMAIGYQNQRKQQINKIKDYIEEEEEILKKKLCAEASIDMGISKSTLDDYLERLKDGDYIKVEPHGKSDKKIIYKGE